MGSGVSLCGAQMSLCYFKQDYQESGHGGSTTWVDI